MVRVRPKESGKVTKRSVSLLRGKADSCSEGKYCSPLSGQVLRGPAFPNPIPPDPARKLSFRKLCLLGSLAFKAKPLKPEHSLNCARRCPSARLRAILAEWWSIMTIKTLGSVSIVKNDQTTSRAGRLSGEKTVRTGVLCAVSQGHLLLRRLYRKKCPGEGGYFAQTFSELVRQRL